MSSVCRTLSRKIAREGLNKPQRESYFAVGKKAKKAGLSRKAYIESKRKHKDDRHPIV